MKRFKLMGTTGLLTIVMVGCGAQSKEKDSSAEPKEPTQTVQQPEDQGFPLVGLPEQVLPYATCGREGKAYDRDAQTCRELTEFEQSLQGFYRAVEVGQKGASERTLEIIGNLQVEVDLDGSRYFQEMTLTNPQKDELSEVLEELHGFKSMMVVEDLSSGNGDADFELMFRANGHVKFVEFISCHYEIQFLSDTNPRDLK